ncbi:pirin family protein [Anaerosphaera multitolerans]|uniref:Pirin family protein n=1 Tax=Anaerosphaera multitolerans TaxID=2487351 RepID=A0A437S7X7_9FIRM|nr:pirin family protein [Anaerosphaera multitolerans]RVU55018.1 pirin family protein [Anaerosphaera multitolerans]
MIRKLDNEKMGRSNLGWLRSVFHFSFAEYRNPNNVNFGKLRVINDDLVEPGTGFDTHPHRDMEIVSYVIKGELTHKDSMGHERTLSRGSAQYMSAGTGILHSEYNKGNEILRFMQIWIFPDENNLTPQYGDMTFEKEERHNKWLNIVSGIDGDAPIKIHQDASIHVLELDKDREIEFPVLENRQAYLVQIEGSSIINGIEFNMRDGLESVEESLNIKALEDSHFLVVELKKE